LRSVLEGDMTPIRARRKGNISKWALPEASSFEKKDCHYLGLKKKRGRRKPFFSLDIRCAGEKKRTDRLSFFNPKNWEKRGGNVVQTGKKKKKKTPMVGGSVSVMGGGGEKKICLIPGERGRGREPDAGGFLRKRGRKKIFRTFFSRGKKKKENYYNI